jgi:hypothetical protein
MGGYAFRLIDTESDAILMQGFIFARVDELAGPTP